MDGKGLVGRCTRRAASLGFPAEVTVAYFLDHSPHQVVDAAFDEFTLEKIEKK